ISRHNAKLRGGRQSQPNNINSDNRAAMSRKLPIILALLSVLLLSPIRRRAATPLADFDLIVVGGRIVDGTGNPWFEGDVAIKDGRIADMGQLDPKRAQKVIDVRGLIVAPGFIDVHTHIEGG